MQVAAAQDRTTPMRVDPADEEREARLEKLRLEIAGLKKAPHRSWSEIVPLITVLVTVGSLWSGAFKYLEDKKEARLTQQTAQVDGYRRHVGFIRDAGERQRAIASFGEALNNPNLATKLFE